MFNIKGCVTKCVRKSSKSLFGTNKTLVTIIRNAHKIPDHLAEVEKQQDPHFSEMVQLYFHRAVQILEPKFKNKLRGKYADPDARVRAIVQIMQSCQAVLSMTFPIRRDDDSFELIRGYRAHHCSHRVPVKGGKYEKF